MRITCPSCQATYDVPDALLAASHARGARAPAKVRCARCATEWAPVELSQPPASPPPPPAPAPSPFADALAQALPVRPPPPQAESPPEAPPPAAEPSPPAFPHAPDRMADEQRGFAHLPRQPRVPPPAPRDSVTLFFAWSLSLGVLAALLIAAYVHHAEVVALWPEAARAYDLLGLR